MKNLIPLFLDIDGVLHAETAASDLELLTKAPLLWEILRACPATEVVISSSWRNTRTLAEITTLVTAGGGEDLANRFVGVTPIIPPSDGRDDYRRREIECLAWLQENEERFPIHRRPPPWLALDDIAYWFSMPCWNLHLVDYRTGLTERDVEQVIGKIRALEAGK